MMVVIALLLAALTASPAAAICYYPDGSVAQGDVPCTDSTTQSSCCGQGYACLGNADSAFFICQSTGDEVQRAGASTFVRGSCTDQKWRNARCPSVCVNPNAPYNDMVSGGMGIAQCNASNDTFYCIDNVMASVNCSAGLGVFKFPQTPTILTTIGIAPSTTSNYSSSTATSSSISSTTPSPTTSNSTITPAPTPTPTTAVTQTPSSTAQLSLPMQTVIGLSVGLSLSLLGLISACLGIFLWRRRRRAAASDTAAPNNDSFQDGSEVKLAAVQATLHEAPGTEFYRWEVPADSTYRQPPAELPHRYTQRYEAPTEPTHRHTQRYELPAFSPRMIQQRGNMPDEGFLMHHAGVILNLCTYLCV
ncbi:hypothetical protein QBC46DRAFT_383822 [Diplogelasinospora grovesii]|uniref:Mid2 domain-containing protein n=1 Tax=Diplogelasinospora grovesii TaxID=303347 RepID=A0AAN6S4N4_9PEZI|nr:hypothetical protein QBC46DRAFT_383822 [Diplogelasinospora grovesii]